MGAIYKISFINNGGRVYIGSCVNFDNRKYRHLRRMRLNTHKNQHLQNAYNKYGFQNIKFEILEEVENKELLIEREQFWIDSFDFNMLYNIVRIAGSRLGIPHSDETKAKMSDARLKLWADPEYALKLSLAQIERNKNFPNSFKGKHHTEGTKKRLSEANKGKKQSQSSIEKQKKTKLDRYGPGAVNKVSVNQLCLETGNVLNTFESIRIASEYTGACRSHIGSVCQKKRKSSGGFGWEYTI